MHPSPVLCTIALALAGFAAPAFALAPAVASAQDFEPVLLGTAAGRPTAIEFAPGVDDQLYLSDKQGRVWRFRDGNYVGTPVLDIRASVDDTGEGGLIGFVFDPEFEMNGYFYLAYNMVSTTALSATVISRFTMMPGSVDIADPASEHIIKGPIPQQTEGHMGGDLEFGPDGMLYHAIGDGDAGSALNLPTAMDLSDPRGKVLRFDVRAPHPHVPADNPYAGSTTNDPHIWVSGFRNPFRLDVDPVTGDVFVGDVGASTAEEITRISVATDVGGFAGWPCREGFDCRNFPGCVCTGTTDIDPIAVLGHTSPDFACAIMGGTVVRGGPVASLEGSYLFTDFCSGRFYRIDDPSGAASVVEISDVLNAGGGSPIRYVVDFTVGNDGLVYFCSHYGAQVWVLEPRGGFGTYCQAASNSTGLAASIVLSGSPSISRGALQIDVTNLPPAATGIFILSQSTLSLPNFNGSQGTLCVNLPIYRWSAGGAASGSGTVSYLSDLTDLPPQVSIAPGETWYFQYWHRDLNPLPTSNASNGASVLFLP
ncbi:Quinoprotein glucose dehydrogenase B precursor [Planctomycetes bacterium Poly30]|uniref:Quinoprotein glucose dehydrogenase B n=1 Tax=Saltatorellus ferox TaxID=2528018 RepID=A0A518EWZ6_9BACT|nr:Quinoprotein glucose dehydrogenase B precursor [Planctomycetes bacterium Poly30]